MKAIVAAVAFLMVLIGTLPDGPARSVHAAGVGDPLSLADVGVVIPYFASEGNTSTLIVSSPVGPNQDLLMIFFSATCSRLFSAPIGDLATNGTKVIDIGSVPLANDGLLVIGRTPNGFSLIPVDNPIHARVVWKSEARGSVRILEPITVGRGESGPLEVWNPLRSGAGFFAPLQVERIEETVESTLYLVCPTIEIRASFGVRTGAPPLGAAATGVLATIYSLAGTVLGSFTIPCSCLTAVRLADLHPVYSNGTLAPDGTFTELLGTPVGIIPGRGFGSSSPFTGYLGTLSESGDAFGRLQAGSGSAVTGTQFPNGR